MEVKARCPNPDCRKSYRVPLTAIGRGTTCKKCGQKFVLKEEKEATESSSSSAVVGEKVSRRADPVKPSLTEIVAERPVPAFKPTPEPPYINQTVVSVTVPKKHGSSLGIASLVLGCLAFLICWIPLVNLIGVLLAGIGFLLAVVGLIVALVRGGAGIGFPIAGASICGVAILVSVLITGSLVAGAKAVGDQMVEEVKRQNATNQVVVRASQERPSADGGVKPEKPKAPIAAVGNQPEPVPANEPPKPEEEESWASADSPVQQGDVEVRVVSVKVGKVPLKEKIGGGESSSKDSLLSIAFELTNRSETKKMNYRSWGADTPAFVRSSPALTDNFDNRYKGISFGFGADVVGSVSSESIYPGKSVSDVIIFEEPIGKAEYLNLELPASNFGGEGKLRLRIPATMIQR